MKTTPKPTSQLSALIGFIECLELSSVDMQTFAALQYRELVPEKTGAVLLKSVELPDGKKDFYLVGLTTGEYLNIKRNGGVKLMVEFTEYGRLTRAQDNDYPAEYAGDKVSSKESFFDLDDLERRNFWPDEIKDVPNTDFARMALGFAMYTAFEGNYRFNDYDPDAIWQTAFNLWKNWVKN